MDPLGILWQTLIHGVVHAAQATPVEREAFEIQGRLDAVPLLLKQIKKRCLKGKLGS
jgi:hypothetical protein